MKHWNLFSHPLAPRKLPFQVAWFVSAEPRGRATTAYQSIGVTKPSESVGDCDFFPIFVYLQNEGKTWKKTSAFEFESFSLLMTNLQTQPIKATKRKTSFQICPNHQYDSIHNQRFTWPFQNTDRYHIICLYIYIYKCLRVCWTVRRKLF